MDEHIIRVKDIKGPWPEVKQVYSYEPYDEEKDGPLSKRTFKVAHLSETELRRHALVSTNNRHYCTDCFCCACVDELNRRMSLASVIEKRKKTP
jgi:hypothetical protein